MEALAQLVAMLNGYEGPLTAALLVMCIDTNRKVRALHRQLMKTKKDVSILQKNQRPEVANA